MSYIVIAYPKLSKKDMVWIQSYRKKNDSRYFSVILPHITLVFAIHDMTQKAFVQEMKAQLKNLKKINFVINVATINQDDSKEYYHEFLVPDQGYSDIVKLHDKLYSSSFKKYLRFDIDFIPHIGIGNSNKSMISKKRIDNINKKGVRISGSIDDIDIVEYKDGKIAHIKKIALK